MHYTTTFPNCLNTKPPLAPEGRRMEKWTISQFHTNVKKWWRDSFLKHYKGLPQLIELIYWKRVHQMVPGFISDNQLIRKATHKHRSEVYYKMQKLRNTLHCNYWQAQDKVLTLIEVQLTRDEEGTKLLVRNQMMKHLVTTSAPYTYKVSSCSHLNVSIKWHFTLH